MIVYHGSNIIVNLPDIEHSFRPLDFGKGFYVTTVREQALKEMKVYRDYDQIALMSQRAINQLLYYESFYEVMKI